MTDWGCMKTLRIRLHIAVQFVYNVFISKWIV
jgi:hypothetical protein